MTAVQAGGVIAIPEASEVRRTPIDEIDQAVADVASNRKAWVDLPIRERIRLLDEVVQATYDCHEEWVQAAMARKGIDPLSASGGEDLSTGPLMLIRQAKVLARSLAGIQAAGEVKFPGKPHLVVTGQVAVPIFPTSALDRAIFVGHKAELWLQPHVTLDTVQAGLNYSHKGDGGVCFVLGAGNISSIGASDCLHKLFANDQVCVLKMNPVNAHVGPFIEQALAPLIRDGFVRIVYGGTDEGKHLTDHPDITSIHMTASDKTYEAVVFGGGKQGAKNKERGQRVTDKPVTAELGNVTPIIVVPGPWTGDDIAYQGKQIASMLTQNAGFNCGAGRMVVTHRAWNKRRALLDAIRSSLAEAPYREPYYPGARDRWETFTSAHPEAETFGPTDGDSVPWTFITDLDPTNNHDVAFRAECFNGILAEVSLDSPRDVGAFIEQAVDFCNDVLWGTLTATVLAHPKSKKDPIIKAALDRGVANLRYGAIGVNVWGATVYGTMSGTWGGFPGHTDQDIQSGVGVVHNTYFLEDAEKTVISAPWTLGKKPPMSYDFTTMPSLARKLIKLEAFGDWKQLPGIVVDGIRA